LIIRHGDRAPANVCWKDGPSWDCQNFGHIGKSTSESYTFDSFYLRNEIPGTCEKGQLTSKGYEQHLKNGAFLRDLYINQQSFLPLLWNPNHFYLRTTHYQRTKLSAKALMEGLYPIKNTDPNYVQNTIDFITRDSEQENMMDNSLLCPILDILEEDVKNSEEVMEFQKTVNDPLLKELVDIFGWSTEKSILNVFDCFQTHACHGMKFPDQMSTDFYNKVRDNLIWLTKATNTAQRQNYTYAQIAIASFLQDILDLLHSVHSNTSSVKFALYSGHDTTLLPLLISYDIWDGQWPSYASLLRIELLSDPQNGKNFVRLVYNNECLRLPGCEYRELCPYEEFREITLKIVGAMALCNKTEIIKT